MASPLPAEPHDGPYTIEDLVGMPDDGRRYEIVYGSLLASPAPSNPHNVAATRLVARLNDAAPADLEATVNSAIRIGSSAPIPDAVVAESAALAKPDPLDPADVLLVVEVVSPGNRGNDYIIKPFIYAEAGIPVFLRVETEGASAPRVEVLVLRDGRYVPTASAVGGETVRLHAPFEVTFDPAELVGPRRRRS